MYHHRGSAFAEQGKYLEAIADYDIAIRLQPDYPDIYLDRGNSYYAMERHEHALKDYSEAIRLSPGYAEAFANRAAVYAALGHDKASNDDAMEAEARGINFEALQGLLEDARKTQD